jgi:hypothetical protein
VILSYIVYCIVFFTSVVTVRRCAYTPRTGYRAYGMGIASFTRLSCTPDRGRDGCDVTCCGTCELCARRVYTLYSLHDGRVETKRSQAPKLPSPLSWWH